MKKQIKTAVTVFCVILTAVCLVFQAAVLISASRKGKTATAFAEVVGENAGYYPLSAADEILLAKFVCFEGYGEPFVCKVAIAATVLNRIGSDAYPSSLATAVYDAQAFDFADKASSADSVYFDDASMRSAHRAVHLARQGQDPTRGATCFYKHSGQSNTSDRLLHTVTFQAGDMIFGN